MATGQPPPPELSPATALRSLGRQPRKGLSQSFLTDPGVCVAMAGAAEIGPADDVLEIGPGLGILTRVLIERAKRVVAVELDRELAARLPNQVSAGNLVVVQADALDFDPRQQLGDHYKLVANLPYHVSSPVLTRYLFDVGQPDVLVVMLQREVADRIAARPGQASYLSTVIQAVAEVSIVRRVAAGAFYPRPKVESAVLRIKPHARPAVAGEQCERFRRLVRAGFTQPRKTLANSLAQGLERPRREVEIWLRRANLDPATRPQHLEVGDWLTLLGASEEPP